MQTLDAVFDWLLRASWQASVLVALVLVTQRLFGSRLSPGWRYALWLLVLARLVMPVSPQSRVSVFNFTRLNSPAPRASTAAAPNAPISPVPPLAQPASSAPASSNLAASSPTLPRSSDPRAPAAVAPRDGKLLPEAALPAPPFRCAHRCSSSGSRASAG